MESDELIFVPAIITCRTSGCANSGIGLAMAVRAPLESALAVCGVCDKPTTDVHPA